MNVLVSNLTKFMFIAILVTSVQAEEIKTDDGLLGDGSYVLNVGVAIKSLDLDVYDAGSLNSNGTLTEGEYTTYSLSVNTPYSFFSRNSRFGYYIEYAFSKFEMNFQLVNNQTVEVDLGTGVDGYFFSVTPVVFYNFFDSIKAKKRDSLIVGVGLGVGYLDAVGDIEFTETDNSIHIVDVKEFDISVGILLEYQHNNIFTRVIVSGPDISSGDFEYTISDIALVVGYSFIL